MKGNAVTHLLKYLCGVEGANSQTTLAERQILKKYSAGLETAVEIGVYEGINTVLIANSLADNGRLYGIDPFFKGALGVSYHEIIARKELKKNGVLAKVTLLPIFSFKALGRVPDELDFIFIDGDHSYKGIKQDWDDWSRKVKTGGIIALHDTSIPVHDQTVEGLGSFKYFQEVIQFDSRFVVRETVDSLNVLQCIKNG